MPVRKNKASLSQGRDGWRKFDDKRTTKYYPTREEAEAEFETLRIKPRKPKAVADA